MYTLYITKREERERERERDRESKCVLIFILVRSMKKLNTIFFTQQHENVKTLF